MNDLFIIPSFDDPVDQRRANILSVTQLSSSVMITAILIISVILTPEHKEVLLQAVVGTGAMIGSYFLLRKGYLNISAWIVVVMGWLILTLDLALISGIRGVNVLGQVLIVMFAGLVLNGRSALLVTLVTLGVNFLIFRLELTAAWSSLTPLPSNFARWFIQSIYLSLAAVYIWRVDSVINKAIKESLSTADRFQALFEHTNDCVVVFDADWRVEMANPQVEKMLGYTREEVLGSPLFPEKISFHHQSISEYQEQIYDSSEIEIVEQTLTRKDGELIPVEISITIVPDDDGHPCRIQCVLRDISERKEVENRLKHQALHDPLTDLPNRAYFDEFYNQIEDLSGETEELVAVMFLDLDDFKNVNDHYGHQVGDQVLIQLASRLQKSLRETDTVARIGGDEFLIILDNVTSKQSVERVAEKINRIISQPYTIDDLSIDLSASIGINITQRHLLDQIDIFLHSDQAMYQVKQSGKDSYQFYEIDGKSTQDADDDIAGE